MPYRKNLLTGLIIAIACLLILPVSSACRTPAFADPPAADNKPAGQDDERPKPKRKRPRRKQAEEDRQAEAERRQWEQRQAFLSRIEQMRTQERNRKPAEHEKQHSAIRRAFSEVVQDARQSTALVLCDDEQAALGTIVTADGHVLTKASELHGKIECKLKDRKPIAAEIIGVSETHDLAMLKIDAENLMPVTWREGEPLRIGSFLATPGVSSEPVAIGVVSVAGRELTQRGILGIAFDPDGAEPKIGQVLPQSAAAKAGLKQGDLILKIDDQAIEKTADVVEVVGAKEPGEEVRIVVQRGDEEIDVTATLTGRLSPQRQSRLDRMNMLGTELSTRRSDFPAVLQHDTALEANQCGGPLVDLDGTAVGVNIARAGRIDSYALPAAVVRPLIEPLKSGEMKPSEAFFQQASLRAAGRKVAQSELALWRAEQAKAAAGKALEKAREALEEAKEAEAELRN